MDLTMLNDAARATHLLGLALGFGVAILADLCAARSLFRPLDYRELETLHQYHRTVALGLALFWASGLVLLWLRTGFQPENFSPKLMTKLGVVSLLTVNAVLIGRIGLPTMIAWQGFDASGTGVFGRFYGANGTPTTGEERLNATTTDDQGAPAPTLKIKYLA